MKHQNIKELQREIDSENVVECSFKPDLRKSKRSFYTSKERVSAVQGFDSYTKRIKSHRKEKSERMGYYKK